MKTFVLVLLLFVISGFQSTPVSLNDEINIKEWQVPWEDTRPRDPYVDQQGRVWFCGQKGNYIAYLEPKTGEFKRYEILDGTHPHNLIVDDEGMVWYAGNRNAHIGTLNPDTGEIKQYPMPEEGARDPHTLVFDHNGDIWFTVQGGNYIGKLMTKTGEVKLVKVVTSRSRPYGIKVDSNNRPWVVLFGTNKIATVDPETMELEEIELPRPETRPRRMEITSDNTVWYVDYAQGYLGSLNTETREIKEWELPGGSGSRPYGTAKDDKDRIWLVETGSDPNKFVIFDPSIEKFTETKMVPSGGGTIRYMYFHPSTQEIWFGADSNTVGRAKLQDVSML